MSKLSVKQRCPDWLDNAHKTFDAAVAAAYGWDDYTPETPDDMILSRLLDRAAYPLEPADYLNSGDDIRLYLEAYAEDDPGDGSLIRLALGYVARARNFSALARDVGVSREGAVTRRQTVLCVDVEDHARARA